MVHVTHDGTSPRDVKENCCVCRNPTRYWYTPKDVALCPRCAKTAKAADLPTKEEWCNKEAALMRPQLFPHQH